MAAKTSVSSTNLPRCYRGIPESTRLRTSIHTSGTSSAHPWYATVTSQKEITMRVRNRLLMIVLAAGAAAAVTSSGFSSSPSSTTAAPAGPAAAAAPDMSGQEEFGAYQPVADFPPPPADTA